MLAYSKMVRKLILAGHSPLFRVTCGTTWGVSGRDGAKQRTLGFTETRELYGDKMELTQDTNRNRLIHLSLIDNGPHSRQIIEDETALKIDESFRSGKSWIPRLLGFTLRRDRRASRTSRLIGSRLSRDSNSPLQTKPWLISRFSPFDFSSYRNCRHESAVSTVQLSKIIFQLRVSVIY